MATIFFLTKLQKKKSELFAPNKSKLLLSISTNSSLSNKKRPRQTSKSVGVIFLLSAYQICLSVGAFFERPRANTVRPYQYDVETSL